MINQHQKWYKIEAEKKKTVVTRRPEWLKVKLPSGRNFTDVKDLMRKKKLNTVCEEARCPNLAECWDRRTATFMILGDTCTRSCGFCAVNVGMPNELDIDEPARVAESVKALDLKHVVITSVNRDELKDGGAFIFSETVKLINEEVPGCTVEILIPSLSPRQLFLQLFH